MTTPPEISKSARCHPGSETLTATVKLSSVAARTFEDPAGTTAAARGLGIEAPFSQINRT